MSVRIRRYGLNDRMYAIAEKANFDTSPLGVLKGTEVELKCDPNLHYVHVIDAIEAVSGKVKPDGEIVRLFEKVKFAPRRKAGG